MIAMRFGLVVLLLAGCTKTAAPPSQPPADDVEEPEPSDDPEAQEDVPEIDGTVRIEGPLKEEQVQAVVQEHFTEIQKCFNEALVHVGDSTNLNGGVAVKLEIDAGGKVTNAELDASNLGDEAAPTCIIGHVETWSFPKAKQPSTVTYPFFLRSY